MTGHETVLLVEDDATVRGVTRRLLERQGYHVLEAASSVAAIDIAALFGGDIHLLLIDLVMPDLAGRIVAERVRALRPGVRILYMSGFGDSTVELETVTHPGLAFIAKPFSSASLKAKVRETLDAF
jgi:two-component system cell cycle sensor histidine kinase/response regulator CckA